MSYRVNVVPDGTLQGRQWGLGVSDEHDLAVAFVEESAVSEAVLVDCWRAACSPKAGPPRHRLPALRLSSSPRLPLLRPTA